MNTLINNNSLFLANNHCDWRRAHAGQCLDNLPVLLSERTRHTEARRAAVVAVGALDAEPVSDVGTHVARCAQPAQTPRKAAVVEAAVLAVQQLLRLAKRDAREKVRHHTSAAVSKTVKQPLVNTALPASSHDYLGYIKGLPGFHSRVCIAICGLGFDFLMLISLLVDSYLHRFVSLKNMIAFAKYLNHGLAGDVPIQIILCIPDL